MRHDVTPSPASLSAEEMCAALTAAATLSGSELKRAATHLVTSSGLPGRADFARHITLTWAEVPDIGRALTDVDQLQRRIAILEQELAEVRGQLDERTEELAAARGANRELTRTLNQRN